MKLLFDIESTGLLRQVSQIHCIVAQNLDDDDSTPLVFDTVKNNVDEGIDFLESAEMLAGHNILNYDVPLLTEVRPSFKCPTKIRDTLIMSRIYFSTLTDQDFQRNPFGLPKKLYGRHSLKAWGIRLGEHKGDFGEANDWSTYSEEMLAYCIQDILTNLKLYRMLERQEHKYS